MKISPVIFGVAIAALSKIAAAATWWIFASGPTGSIAYDKGTINRNGSHVLVWRRDSFTTPQNIDGSHTYNEQRYRIDLDCARGTAEFLEGGSYLNGTRVLGQTLPDVRLIDNIHPDEVNAWLEKQVCN